MLGITPPGVVDDILYSGSGCWLVTDELDGQHKMMSISCYHHPECMGSLNHSWVRSF